MIRISSLFIPAVISGIAIFGLLKGRNIFEDFIEGAFSGITVVYRITPTMLAIMLAVGMFKASGGLELISFALEPIVSLVAIPKEVVPLMLMRPISGTGALAIFKDIIAEYHPDSYVGRVASVMQGSTETTFYTIALYYGVTKVKKTKHTLTAAITGDIVGFIMSAVTVTLFMCT